MKLYDFVRRVDVAIDRIREAELHQNFNSTHIEPQMLTHLKLLEKHAGDVYMPNVLVRVQEQIHDEHLYNAVRSDPLTDENRYLVSKYASPTETYVVHFNGDHSIMHCTCTLLTYIGKLNVEGMDTFLISF